MRGQKSLTYTVPKSDVAIVFQSRLFIALQGDVSVYVLSPKQWVKGYSEKTLAEFNSLQY